MIDRINALYLRFIESPLIMGITGVTTGGTSMALNNWKTIYDESIFRISATATAVAAVLSALLLVRKVARDFFSEPIKPQKRRKK